MITPVSAMSLGDIFDQIFKLTAKTFIRNFFIVSLLLVPSSVTLAFGLEAFISSLMELALQQMTPGAYTAEQLHLALRSIASLSVGMGMLSLTLLAAKLGVTIIACSEMSGQDLAWQDALVMAFGVKLWRLSSQVALLSLSVGGLAVLPYLMLMAGTVARSPALALLGVPLFLLTVPLAVFYWVRWEFALPSIAWENAGVSQSFDRSAKLVQGLWWRTFGLLFLLGLICQFALSLLTTPISLLALWDFYAKYLEIIASSGSGKIDPAVSIDLFDSIGLRLGLVTSVSLILSTITSPLITTVMYFDLRARKGESA
ncbi:MAG: hypothetical protein ACREOO_19435 [bacterium]